MTREILKAEAMKRKLAAILRDSENLKGFGYWRGYVATAIRELEQSIDGNKRVLAEQTTNARTLRRAKFRVARRKNALEESIPRFADHGTCD